MKDAFESIAEEELDAAKMQLPPSAASFGYPPNRDKLVDALATTIRIFVHKCRKANIEAEFCALAMDYLKRKGLQGSPLREQ